MEDKIIIKTYTDYNNENNFNESVVLDLYSRIDVEVNSREKINTGICISLPKNLYMRIKIISSLASKGLSTIGGFNDKNYSNEIIVIMNSLAEPIKTKKGQKIAQLIIFNKNRFYYKT